MANISLFKMHETYNKHNFNIKTYEGEYACECGKLSLASISIDLLNKLTKIQNKSLYDILSTILIINPYAKFYRLENFVELFSNINKEDSIKILTTNHTIFSLYQYREDDVVECISRLCHNKINTKDIDQLQLINPYKRFLKNVSILTNPKEYSIKEINNAIDNSSFYTFTNILDMDINKINKINKINANRKSILFPFSIEDKLFFDKFYKIFNENTKIVYKDYSQLINKVIKEYRIAYAHNLTNRSMIYQIWYGEFKKSKYKVFKKYLLNNVKSDVDKTYLEQIKFEKTQNTKYDNTKHFFMEDKHGNYVEFYIHSADLVQKFKF